MKIYTTGLVAFAAALTMATSTDADNGRAPQFLTFANATGMSATYSTTGALDLANPYYGDGFVSKAEFMAQADRNFARCDADKDGRINTAECRQALRRQPADRARQER